MSKNPTIEKNMTQYLNREKYNLIFKSQIDSMFNLNHSLYYKFCLYRSKYHAFYLNSKKIKQQLFNRNVIQN